MENWINKLKGPASSANSLPGMGIALAYILTIFTSTLMVTPNVSYLNIEKILWGCIKGTIISIVVIYVFIFISDCLTKILVKRIKNRQSIYTMKEIVTDTMYWIPKIIDFLMSVLIPGAIALFYFNDGSSYSLAEGWTNLIIIALMPTLIGFKLYEYGTVIIIALLEIFLLICSFLKDLVETAYLLFLELIDKNK